MPDRRRIVLMVLFVVIGIVLVAHAWSYTFLCDDAYISFRYARNLTEGHGLVFNPGERVEGYTNFAWTLLLAAIWAVGVGPEDSAIGLGLLFTVGTAAVVARLAWTSPLPRAPVVMVSLLLFATNRSVAVWATSGLETRMFTFFVLGAIAALHGARGRIRWLLVGSLALGLAELTRPEALLFAPIAIAWSAAGILRTPGSIRVRQLAALVGPAACTIVAHFAFRLVFYGEWLPNTYYAKGTLVWPEAGLHYLAAAAIEHGALLLLPLAAIGALTRWRAKDGLHGLSLLLIAPHLLYLIRIGGDHFEYRMLDLAFPLLQLAAADGLVAIARGAGSATPAVGIGLAAAATFYQGAIPWLDRAATAGLVKRRTGIHRDLGPEHGPWVWRVPLVPQLARAYNHQRRWCARHWVGTRWVEHRNLWLQRTDHYGPYRAILRDRFPDDLVAGESTMGIVPFILADVTFVDWIGLTDAVVARSPEISQQPGRPRKLAHTQRKVAPYITGRTNVRLDRPAPDPTEALQRATHAAEVAPGVWMPFEGDPGLLQDFEVVSGQPLRVGDTVHDPEDRPWTVVRILEDFEAPMVGWTRTGRAFNRTPSGALPRQPKVWGQVGDGFVNSFHPRLGNEATGTLLSPPYRVEAGQGIAALVAGGAGPDLGLRLRQRDHVGPLQHGRKSSVLRLQVWPIDEPGPVQIEILDHGTGTWGHVLVDQLAVVQPKI